MRTVATTRGYTEYRPADSFATASAPGLKPPRQVSRTKVSARRIMSISFRCVHTLRSLRMGVIRISNIPVPQDIPVLTGRRLRCLWLAPIVLGLLALRCGALLLEGVPGARL